MSDYQFTNPFNITKSVDFSDEQIEKYWVDVVGSGDESFFNMIKPTSPMPMMILGGKGSGKTHIMRYFSFSLQKLRHKEGGLLRGISKDKYIGVYFRCGGVNAGRFGGKGYSDEQWNDVFQYYMELWFSQILLAIFKELSAEKVISNNSEKKICLAICELFSVPSMPEFDSFDGLSDEFSRLRKEVDFVVNNCAIKRNLDNVTVTINRGDMVFGIPAALNKYIPELNSPLFVYLVDEYENLSKLQQQYLNTLIRERKDPCSIKIGARLYGVKTHLTFSGGEVLKDEAEYETIHLDERLRKKKTKYKSFAKKLVLRRLLEHDFDSGLVSDDEGSYEQLSNFFEIIETSSYETNDTKPIALIKSTSRGHIRSLLRKMKLANLEDEKINIIISNLACENYPILEKINLLLFYQKWNSGNDLLKASEHIQKCCTEFIVNGVHDKDYTTRLSHFKTDMVAQLRRDFKIPVTNSYTGLENVITLSMGLPRNLLVILKQIYSWANFNGEKINKNPISLKSQRDGILEASDWFFRETKTIWDEGQNIQESISRLALLFKSIRFSDKPSECSVNSFSYDPERISEESAKIIKFAIMWSLLVHVNTQKDRNSSALHPKVQINRILCPRWDLPLGRRGVIALNAREVDAIFDYRKTTDFDSILKERIDRMTAPNFGKTARSTATQQQLPY